jgi:CDP-diacylglycerol--glycerol-3-phosphate 3-phosphatidyltransferase
VFATRGARYSARVSSSTSPATPAAAAPAAAPRAGTGAFARDIRTLPNLVSIARIVFIYVGIILWYYGYFATGLLIGIFAGLSDYLDGYLARRLNQSTRIGGLLDQAADILFISGCIFIFVDDRTWPAVLLFTVIFRETLVMNLRASAAEMGFSLPSIFLGKWASNWMFYSLALMGAARGKLLPEPYNTWIFWVAHFGMLVGIVSSMITAAIYLRSYVRQYRPSAGRSGAAAAALPAPVGRGDEVAHGGARDDQ